MSQLVYPILDIDTCRKRSIEPLQAVRPWMEAGLRAFQLRWKNGARKDVLALALALKETFPSSVLIANDDAELALEAPFSLVHVGQEDFPLQKQFLKAGRYGISTHSPAQMAAALELAPEPAYIALGPVRTTQSKPSGTDPVLLRDDFKTAVECFARSGTRAGLVLIGGIHAGNVLEVLEPVLEAGLVPAVAVIQAALGEGLPRLAAILDGLPGRRVGLPAWKDH